MFRRPTKNTPEEPTSLYGEEAPTPPFIKYSVKKNEMGIESHHGLFEPTAPRAVPMEGQEESWVHAKSSTLPHHFDSLQEEAPETTLGAGVTFRGEVTFEKFLRIDGTFTGELHSQPPGKIVVGATGHVQANLNVREAIIEGRVVGNICVEELLQLRGGAIIEGDIQAKTICIDEGVSVRGYVYVPPPVTADLTTVTL